MSKFDEIISSSKYPELEAYCDGKNLVLGQDVEDSTYKFSIMSKDPSNTNVCSGTITEENIIIFISDKDDNIIETYSQDYKSEEKLFDFLKTTIDVFEAISDIDLEPQDGEILNEITEDIESESEYTSFASGLEDIKSRLEDIADRIISVAEMTDDTELKANIISMSNSALSLSLEVDSNLDFYEELSVAGEDIEDDSDIENESKARYEAVKGFILAKKLLKDSKDDIEMINSLLEKVSK